MNANSTPLFILVKKTLTKIACETRTIPNRKNSKNNSNHYEFLKIPY